MTRSDKIRYKVLGLDPKSKRFWMMDHVNSGGGKIDLINTDPPPSKAEVAKIRREETMR